MALVTSKLRRLSAEDLSSLLSLSTIAGWNQTAADWMLLLELAPDSCLGIESDGRVIATSTLICYGQRLGWLGMVLTHPQYRRQGLARTLVSACLKIADTNKIECLKLDGTDLGVPLYESVGFVREQTIERWHGRGKPFHNTGHSPETQAVDFALDHEAFGADRSTLLRRLAKNGRSLSNQYGFVITRPGANAGYLGPCVARSKEAAKLLIGQSLWNTAAEYHWDLLPANTPAVNLATAFGFQMTRRLIRMRRGADLRGADSMVYAAGGFELG